MNKLLSLFTILVMLVVSTTAQARFTQADTWPGIERKPITLNKYTYANADPVSYTDPTGKFGLASFSAANNIAGTLTSLQIDAGFSILDSAFGTLGLEDDGVAAAQNAYKVLGIAALGAGGIKLAKMLSKKVRSGNVPDVNFGPHQRGPLPPQTARNFRGGVYTQKVLNEPTTFYRVYGGDAPQLSNWWSRTPPAGPLQTSRDLALLDRWGNTQESIVAIRAPKGAIVYEGHAGPQYTPDFDPLRSLGSYYQVVPGGGNQVYIEFVELSWIVR